MRSSGDNTFWVAALRTYAPTAGMASFTHDFLEIQELR